MTLIVKML
jgi:hypothetical protein